MAFLVGSMTVQVYTDSAQTNFPTLYSINEQPTWVNNSILSVQTTTIVLAGSGSQTINLNGLASGSSVTRMYLYSSTSNVNVNMNGLGNILFQAGEPAYLPATITSLVVANASSTVATTVTIGLIGT